MESPQNDDDLDERLSRPTGGVVNSLAATTGDLVVLGAAGKMGPSLARMARRALDTSGLRDRRVIAVSRFSSGGTERLQAWGVDVVRADLADAETVRRLPDAGSVVFMAGQKFGTSSDPASTWGANVVIPTLCLERYRSSRITVFSTGNVYPMVAHSSGGSREQDDPRPIGEYAQSCLGRERVAEFMANRHGTPIAIVRLFYACALRYGVLTDIATRVRDGVPVDVSMGLVNVIWQGDANALALGTLAHASVPPFVVNVTGRPAHRVRDLAERFGLILGRPPRFTGKEAEDALLADTTRMHDVLGSEALPFNTLVEWTANWVASGMPALPHHTGFEQREGRY